MTPRVGRREWDSNLEAVVRGLFKLLNNFWIIFILIFSKKFANLIYLVALQIEK